MSRSTGGLPSGSWSGGEDISAIAYLALVLSSNLALAGCENASSSGQSQRISDEPVITRLNGTPTTTSESLPTPAPPAPRHACYAGYASSGSAARDVLRLGMMCGPSNGLAKEPRIAGKQARSMRLDSGECVWVAAAVPSSSARVELQWVRQDEVLAGCELTGLGWCPPTQPLCVERAGEVRLLVADADDAPLPNVEIWARRHRSAP